MSAAITSEFQPFSRLPLELRQKIWELAMEPREVALGRTLARRSRTASPPILYVNAEARSHLRHLYTACFPRKVPRKLLAKELPPQFSLVNFDIDTVYCSMEELLRCRSDSCLIQRLIVECHDSESFYTTQIHPFYLTTALKTVTILYNPLNIVSSDWWREWDQLMRWWYYRDDPAKFHARIIRLDDPSSFEINQHNYLRVEREWRKNNPPPLEHYPDYQVSDSDDDVDAPWRIRKDYHHVEGCGCTSKQNTYEQIDDGIFKASYKLL